LLTSGDRCGSKETESFPHDGCDSTRVKRGEKFGDRSRRGKKEGVGGKYLNSVEVPLEGTYWHKKTGFVLKLDGDFRDHHRNRRGDPRKFQ